MTEDRFRTLRTALRANAAFSGGSGLALLAGDGFFAALLGAFQHVGEVQLVGAGLVAFAAVLVALARRAAIPAAAARAVVVADAVWVVGSAVALLAAPLPTLGAAAVALVALVVAGLAVWQAAGLRRAA
ncbi:MAG: hypothetical protein R3E88_11975 [Myxococcota bacterium]